MIGRRDPRSEGRDFKDEKDLACFCVENEPEES